ncbi:hypothetical protein DPMN_043262 [Dreissena polymorpha]|uniref:Uncharacterized protein n=1 Tax=Dreissena polymorpha TaxID=45954 RepID=A0A9D4HXN6_DREPO|nr:hypothetical protein DPMN_043262 [Dreissena polymorpha]
MTETMTTTNDTDKTETMTTTYDRDNTKFTATGVENAIEARIRLERKLHDIADVDLSRVPKTKGT